MTAGFISGRAVVDIDESSKKLSKAATLLGLSSCTVLMEMSLPN